MPVRWAVRVEGIDPTHVELDHLHAVTSAWIDDEDHWNSPKPWSVSPMRNLGDSAVIEVSTLTAETGDRLLGRIVPGQRVRFGSRYATLAAAPRQVAAASWDELTCATESKAWQVRFLTPTAFGNRNRFSPWADPLAVARSLTHRWNAVAPSNADRIELGPKECSQIWISDIVGRNTVLQLAGLTISGFVGNIRYVCDDPAVAPLLDQLLRFAEFAGMGRYSARGLGTVRLGPRQHIRR